MLFLILFLTLFLNNVKSCSDVWVRVLIRSNKNKKFMAGKIHSFRDKKFKNNSIGPTEPLRVATLVGSGSTKKIFFVLLFIDS